MKGKGPKPRRLPTSFRGWIAPVYSTSEDEVIRVSGVDAAMYLRLISFGEAKRYCVPATRRSARALLSPLLLKRRL